MGANSNKKRNVPFKEQFRKIEPLTTNQALAFEEFRKGQNLVLHGYAGTGKTLTAMYLALEELFAGRCSNIIIVRSAVASQDIGFLPGSYEEKIAPYEEPYDSLCDFLFKTKGNYDELKDRAFVTFMPISFIRGITFDDAVIVVDEFQNMNYHQLSSVITRVGENTRIIFSGDYHQSDLKNHKDKSGIRHFMRVLNEIPEFSTIQFSESDIVRSGTVKNFIIAEKTLNESGEIVI